MKFNHMIIACCLLAAAVSCTKLKSSTTAPSAVSTAFSQKFPSASDVRWSKEDDGNYEAHFKFNNLDYEAEYSSGGALLVTEWHIDFSVLPQKVVDAANAAYPGYQLIQPEQVQVEGETVKSYEVVMDNHSKAYEITVDESGTITKTETKKCNK